VGARYIWVLAATLGACEPKDPSCGEVSMHVGRMFQPSDAYAQEVEGAFLGRCINDTWGADVRRCLASTRSLEDPKNCKAKLTPAQAAALDKDLARADEREAARVLPKSCLDLEVHISIAMGCAVIPVAERERIQKQFQLTKAGWEKVENKSLLAPTCNAAIAALKQVTYECRPGSSKPAASSSKSPTPSESK
jgi:hypothetical protein